MSRLELFFFVRCHGVEPCRGASLLLSFLVLFSLLFSLAAFSVRSSCVSGGPVHSRRVYCRPARTSVALPPMALDPICLSALSACPLLFVGSALHPCSQLSLLEFSKEEEEEEEWCSDNESVDRTTLATWNSRRYLTPFVLTSLACSTYSVSLILSFYALTVLCSRWMTMV